VSRKDWWFRTGFALIPDVLITLVTLVAIPIGAGFFHPILALSLSLPMIGLYAAFSFLHTIIIYGDESNNYNKKGWDNLGYVEVGLQATLGLCYIGMAVMSCVAVHQWRRAKRNERLAQVGDVELTSFKREGGRTDTD
jgi:hypothetical protein